MRIWLQRRFGFANHLVQIACLKEYEKWVQKEKVTNMPTYFILCDPNVGNPTPHSILAVRLD